MPTNTIVKIIHGSHLFGLNTDSSDRDYKGVFQASLEDIILDQDVKTIIESTSSNDSHNISTDVDIEFKELRTFIKDCLDCQPYALEMLFVTQEFVVESSSTWEFLQSNQDKLIGNDLRLFGSLAFGMSSKFVLRGEGLKELQRVIMWFELQGSQLKLRDVIGELPLSDYIFTDVYKHKLKNQSHPDEQRLCCLGMILQYNKSIKECLVTLHKRLNSNVSNSHDIVETDYKSYSHALRLLYELEELLTQRNLTLPIPKCDLLIKIKKREIELSIVQNLIFDELARIKKLPNNLSQPDVEFWDNWIVVHYSSQIVQPI